MKEERREGQEMGNDEGGVILKDDNNQEDPEGEINSNRKRLNPRARALRGLN